MRLPPLKIGFTDRREKDLAFAPFFTSDGVMPWKWVKARVKLSGESYPYFKAVSIIRDLLLQSSWAARESLRIRI